MKSPTLFLFGIIAILVLPGCFHQSDEEVFSNAQNAYTTVAVRYEELLNAPDDESIVEFGYNFGAQTTLTPWIFSWNNVVTIPYVEEGTPLHKTAYFIQGDCNEISRHLGLLSARVMVSPLYEKLHNMQTNLEYGLQVIKSTKSFAEESRFIQAQRLQAQQLNETQRQNCLIAESNRKPVIVHQEKTVIKCDARKDELVRAPRVEKVVTKEQCGVNPKKKKKKERKDETIINVDDIPGKKAHLII